MFRGRWRSVAAGRSTGRAPHVKLLLHVCEKETRIPYLGFAVMQCVGQEDLLYRWYTLLPIHVGPEIRMLIFMDSLCSHVDCFDHSQYPDINLGAQNTTLQQHNLRIDIVNPHPHGVLVSPRRC